MSEFWEVFKIEARKLISNKRLILFVIASSIAVALFLSFITKTTISVEQEPVRVCANPSLSQVIENAGGTLVESDCEVSISPPGEFYYFIDIYDNTSRISRLEEFASNFINEYYYSSIGITPTTTEKTILIIGDEIHVIDAPPTIVAATLFGTITVLPIVLFMTLLFGNEYIATLITSQRERRILDILSTYPIKRRTIILTKISLGIVFGLFTMLLFIIVSGITLVFVIPHNVVSQAPINIEVTMPTWGVLLSLLNTILAILFTYFATTAIAFRTKDPSETSVSTMIVGSILNFSLIIPFITGSFAIFKYPIASVFIPTLVPIQTALLSLIGNLKMAIGFTLYMFIVTFIMYKVLMREYRKSFE